MTPGPQRAPRAPWIVLAIALLLRLPALQWDFFVDDHGVQLVVEGRIEHPTLRPWSAFDFGSVPPAGSQAERVSGLPWWTSPDWKVRFFRPIPSLTHWLDNALFGRNAMLQHATSLAWFATLLVALLALYRAAQVPERLVPWALAVFAFDDGSLFPVAWLANRNALIEATFAVTASLAALRAGPRPSFAGVALALACALGACLSKESGVAAPLLVSALLARGEGRAARLGALAGLVMSCAYVAFLLGCGYGTRSDFYLTPWGDPVHYGVRLVEMSVLGALSVFGPFAVDAPMFFEELYAPWLAVALIVGGALCVLAWRSARALPLRWFLATWTVLTLLPQAGAFPSDRLLFLPMVGAAPLVAALAAKAFDRAPWKQRLLPAAVALLAVPLSGLMQLARGAGFVVLIDKTNAAAVSLEVPNDGQPHDALVFQSGSLMSMLSPEPVWKFRTGREDLQIHPLQVGPRAVRITTVEASAFELCFESQELLDRPFERVFLAGNARLEKGQHWRHRAFEVEVVEVDRELGRSTLRVRLPQPIASAGWCFLTWREGAFRRFEMPAPGATLQLPEATPLDPLLP